jgi:hypothetical protein
LISPCSGGVLSGVEHRLQAAAVAVVGLLDTLVFVAEPSRLWPRTTTNRTL